MRVEFSSERPTAHSQLDTMRGLLIGLDRGIFRGRRKKAAQTQLTTLAKKILLSAHQYEIVAIDINFGYDQRGSDPTRRALASGLREEFVKAAVSIIEAKGPGAIEAAVARLPKKG